MSAQTIAPPSYTVHAAGTANCPCGAGETWDVVLHVGTPEELAMSTSFDYREHAEDLAEDLNGAYAAGKEAAEATIKRLEAEKVELESERNTAHALGMQWHQIWLMFRGDAYNQAAWLAEYVRVFELGEKNAALQAKVAELEATISQLEKEYADREQEQQDEIDLKSACIDGQSAQVATQAATISTLTAALKRISEKRYPVHGGMALTESAIIACAALAHTQEVPK